MANIQTEYSKALNRFRVNLSRGINNKINKQTNNIVYSLMLNARSKAQSNILATPITYTLGSERALANLANRIVIKQTKSKKLNAYKLTVSNLQKENDFALFLEYGTGFMAKRKSPPSKDISWAYMVNDKRNYITTPAFMFDAKKDSFVYETDRYPMILHSKKKIRDHSFRTVNGKEISYIRTAKVKDVGKNGKIIRKNGYAYYPSKPDYSKVLSFGIKPVRYMYKTRKFIKEEIKKLSKK